MDWLDKIGIAIISVLSLVTVGMLTNHEIATYQQGDNAVSPENGHEIEETRTVEFDPKIYAEVEELQKKGLYTEALAKLETIVAGYPRYSKSYVYMARLNINLGDIKKALQGYRTAVEMEPGYVDKKNEKLFIGRDIKKLVTESQRKIEQEVESGSGGKEAKKALKNIYYLQRRLAGGCE